MMMMVMMVMMTMMAVMIVTDYSLGGAAVDYVVVASFPFPAQTMPSKTFV